MKMARWINRNRDWLAPVVAVVLMVVVVFGQKAITDREHQANIENCQRGNVSRVASVEGKRHDIKFTLRPQLVLWTAAIRAKPLDPSTPKTVAKAFYDLLHNLRRGIASKRHEIHETIAAQAQYAVRPGSPEVDCDRAFP